MCGRMTLTKSDFAEVADLLGAVFDPALAASYRPRYNLPPTDPHMMVVSPNRLVVARWQFGPGKQINARAESVATNGLVRRAFAERRCLVPADGFYEWMGGKGRRQPVWYHAPPGQLLTFAGLYDRDGNFVVMTTTPNAEVAPVHDRMPVIIAPDRRAAWLAAPDAKLLAPAPDGSLVRTLVSARVNSVANDDAACLDPPDQLALV
jgi:putative SOS response-associated peptidase YedK